MITKWKVTPKNALNTYNRYEKNSLHEEIASVLEGGSRKSGWYGISLIAFQNKHGFFGKAYINGEDYGYAVLFRVEGKNINDVKQKLLKKFYSSLKV